MDISGVASLIKEVITPNFENSNLVSFSVLSQSGFSQVCFESRGDESKLFFINSLVTLQLIAITVSTDKGILQFNLSNNKVILFDISAIVRIDYQLKKQ